MPKPTYKHMLNLCKKWASRPLASDTLALSRYGEFLASESLTLFSGSELQNLFHGMSHNPDVSNVVLRSLASDSSSSEIHQLIINYRKTEAKSLMKLLRNPALNRENRNLILERIATCGFFYAFALFLGILPALVAKNIESPLNQKSLMLMTVVGGFLGMVGVGTFLDSDNGNPYVFTEVEPKYAQARLRRA